MHELQIILEDIRNQLTIIKGFSQLHLRQNKHYKEMFLNPINTADKLTEEALYILKMSKCKNPA